MSGRAGTRRAVVELARIRAHVFSQLLERSRGHVRPDHREQRSVGEQGDRIERGQRVETEIPEHVRRHGIDGRRPEQQGIAVRRGAHDFSRAYGAVGARLALHDETLAEARFDPVGYRPEYGFRNAPCGEWDDHANGFAGPSAGLAQDWPSKPIRVVIPFAAGSVSEAIFPTISPRGESALGQRFTVERKPGAARPRGTA